MNAPAGARRRPGWKVALLIMGVAVLALAGWRVAKRTQPPPATPVSVRLVLTAGDVLEAVEAELPQGIAVSGALKARESAWVKARVAGELRELNLREGDPVKAGQVVGRIDPADAQARVRQAQEQADAARAQVVIAQRQFDNNQALVQQGFISRTALDTSQANLDAARANHQATLAAVDLARKGLDDTVMRSPMSGTVAQRLVQAGERVGIDTRVLEVLDLRTLELEAQLTPADAASLKVGQAAEVTLGDLPALAARVARISPSATAGTRTVPVFLALQDPRGLRQGVFVQGRILREPLRGVLVPLDAVRTDQPQPYVVVVEGETARHRTVSLTAQGTRQDRTWVRVEGLKAGERILAGSVGAVRDATLLSVAP